VDREALAGLLGLIFHYDSQGILASVESHVVLSRYAARDVLRHLALLLLEGTALDSERFKQIIAALKEGLDIRGRELFIPFGWRLRDEPARGVGSGDFALDEAANASFAVRVKPARERILEFCAALD